MNVIVLLVAIIILALVLYLVRSAPIGDPVIRWIIIAIVVVLFCLWLAGWAGLNIGVNLR